MVLISIRISFLALLYCLSRLGTSRVRLNVNGLIATIVLSLHVHGEPGEQHTRMKRLKLDGPIIRCVALGKSRPETSLQALVQQSSSGMSLSEWDGSYSLPVATVLSGDDLHSTYRPDMPENPE